jgi:PAS domain S-box-containing protein
MNRPQSQLAFLHDPRLAPYATEPLPAWLWSADASRVLWANAVAAAIFGASGPAVLQRRRFDTGQPTAAQIATLAETLPEDGSPRIERLRGFGAGVGRTLACSCSRITLEDGTAAVLISATERAGPELPLAERVRRLLADVEAPVAVFSPDGALLHATQPARDAMGGATRLAELDPAPAAIRLGGDAGLQLVDLAPPPAVPAIGDAMPEPADAPPMQADMTPEPRDGTPEPRDGTPAPGAETAGTDAPAAPQDTEGGPASERRHPLRFVWQLDHEGRFTVGSDEFLALAGAPTETALGRQWPDVAAALGLDPEGQVADALASRDTWSGIVIGWPMDGTNERIDVELSGLPVFDRNRGFRGYRGFGVCRDLAQIARLKQVRRRAEAQAEPPSPQSEAPVAPAPISRPADERPVLALVSGAENVVPFRSPHAESRAPTLSPVERKAFRELARQLSARLKSPQKDPEAGESDDFDALQPGLPVTDAPEPMPADGPPPAEAAEAPAEPLPVEPLPAEPPAPETPGTERPILDRLPIGVLIYDGEHLRYANRAFLDWAGHADLRELQEAGGLEDLTLERAADDGAGGDRTVRISTADRLPVEARVFALTWDGDAVSALLLDQAADDRQQSMQRALRLAEGDVGELKSILDTATDGVVVLDRAGTVLSANRSAEALFGYEARELVGRAFAALFAPESERAAVDYLDGLTKNGVASVLNDGREVIGLVRGGGLVPLFMTMGRIADGTEKLCAVFRDITNWKKAEEELVNARRQAEKASSAKSDFLAKISHEIRTPLNAIIGFSEVMMEERFGPVGNDRYRDYLKDIHASGEHLVSLINDLLDLSKIEAGKLELTFAGVNLNDLTQQCVAIMQPQANRERIIIRSSLPPQLPQVVADTRSVRQIVLNLLSNSIKFTGPGGQVIVSTALTDDGEVVLRVRDTGVGMSEQDIATAMEPFRQLATSARWGSGGTGLGLPLTKALAEANRASFRIKSAVNAGTLVEVTFPATRVLAE